MKQISHDLLGAFVGLAVVSGAALCGSPASAAHTALSPPAVTKNIAARIAGSPVVLAPRPGTEADRLARQLMASDLAADRKAGETPLVVVGTARVSTSPASEVLFVQLQSARDCGSGGCNTVSFGQKNGKWVRILDTIGGPILIAKTQHMGMHDLIVQNATRLIWDGTRYG